MTGEEIRKNCVFIPYINDRLEPWRGATFARNWCEENFGVRGWFHPYYMEAFKMPPKKVSWDRWSAQYIEDGVDFWFENQEDRALFVLLWG